MKLLRVLWWIVKAIFIILTVVVWGPLWLIIFLKRLF